MQSLQSLFQLGRDAGELAVQGAANRVDSADDHNRNTSSDQTVLNCGRTALILQERVQLTFGGALCYPIRGKSSCRACRRVYRYGRCFEKFERHAHPSLTTGRHGAPACERSG